jgi:hypothetical protein
MSIAPVLLYILYADAFHVRACSREKIGNRVEVCGTLRFRQSSSRRPLSHRAETLPLRSVRDAEWRAKRALRTERARESLPRRACDSRHQRLPAFPTFGAEGHNYRGIRNCEYTEAATREFDFSTEMDRHSEKISTILYLLSLCIVQRMRMQSKYGIV